MSFPAKAKPITYADAVRTFNAPDVQDDINDACGRLANAMAAMMQKLDSITKQMHTIDLLRLTSPMRPKWDSVRQDFTDVLWQFRTNSAVISGRLKLFYTAVLPMAARNVDGRSGGSSQQHENIQVLKSFMTISAEHAVVTRTLADRIFRLSAQLVALMTDFTSLAARHAASGQEEMRELSQTLSELESYIQHLFSATSEVSNADVTHLAFTTSRLVSSAGSTSGRSRITRKPIVMEGELLNIARAYEHIDRKRNEIAHVQYALQLRQNRVDPLATTQTMLSAFLLDQMLTSESGLGLFLSVWSRLRTDCSEIYHWVKNPQNAIPFAISCYRDNGHTLYAPLANGLEVYTSTIEPSVRAPDRREHR